MEYKVIENHPKYKIAEDGTVVNTKTGHVLGNMISTNGYLMVVLSTKSKLQKFNVHRLVAKYFLTDFDINKQVNHIDGNKLNNHYINLEMVSNRENACHRVSATNRQSKYIGVCKTPKGDKWRATIWFQGKTKQIGTFNTEEEAYQARIKFEQENSIENKYL